MANKKFMIISVILLILSAITVSLSIYYVYTTWYANDHSCIDNCGLFSTLSFYLVALSFIINVIFLILARKNAEIQGKNIIKVSLILAMILGILWLFNFLGVFIPTIG